MKNLKFYRILKTNVFKSTCNAKKKKKFKSCREIKLRIRAVFVRNLVPSNFTWKSCCAITSIRFRRNEICRSTATYKTRLLIAFFCSDDRFPFFFFFFCSRCIIFSLRVAPVVRAKQTDS